MAELTPMMQQYLLTKKEYPDCILFYRLGDFYEMFFEDALTASRELSITLTGKSCGQEERAPMCGVPYHAVEGYLSRLVAKGYKVAICEQVEDAKQARGLVRRAVTRIVSAGTNLNVQALDETKNNYLCCVAYFHGRSGLAVADITTGDFYLTETDENKKLLDEIIKYGPSEIIGNDAFGVSGIDLADLKDRLGMVIRTLEARFFDDESCERCLKAHFKTESLQGLGIGDFPVGTIAAGALLGYLYDTQKTAPERYRSNAEGGAGTNPLGHITRLNPYLTGTYMLLDSSTRRNLELTETIREKHKKGSLLGVLDKTKTAMGARTLRAWLEQPLLERNLMEQRLDGIEALGDNSMFRDEIREYLGPIYDLERLLGKISYQTANPRDCIAFRNSLRMLAPIKTVLSHLDTGLLNRLQDKIDSLEDLLRLLEKAITEEPPLAMKEGGIIQNGYDEEVDRLRLAKTEGKNWLAQLEAADRERTGIKNLKVKYNKIFGYYFEVTNSYQNMVPDDYIRKQTLANAERYTTPRLKELEDTILNAEDKLCELEYELFCAVRQTIAAATERIRRTAKSIAVLDVLAALSDVAEHNQYVRPSLNENGLIEINGGRHPVVEQMIDSGMFIANDTRLDNDKNLIAVITGPNMAGKSTYMRQTALIVLMAQIGSFVPAKQAAIGIVDRIFTRVGASDDLASGQSTFMVEMNEVANILRNATADSLLILDEIGRGTSTFDGLSIAWAVIEHISNPQLLGAKTLFATHYHELTELEGRMDNVNNFCIAVHEKGDDIIFLRKIIKGSADRSYGIQVAKLAGVPAAVIERAVTLAGQLSDNDIMDKLKGLPDEYFAEPNPVNGHNSYGQNSYCQNSYGQNSYSQNSYGHNSYGQNNHGHNNKNKRRYPALDDVDLTQMTLFDTVKDEDVLNELRQIDVSTLTPLDALNTLYRLQTRINNRWKH